MRQRGRRGVVPRETPLESGLHGLDAVGHSLLVVGGSSLPATEILGSASAIMPTSSRSNVRQSRQSTHRQASSRHNRKVGIRAVKSPQKLGVHDVNEQGLWASRRANMFTMSSTSTTSAKTPAPSLRSERAECRTTTRRLTCWWDLQLGPRCPAAFPR